MEDGISFSRIKEGLLDSLKKLKGNRLGTKLALDEDRKDVISMVSFVHKDGICPLVNSSFNMQICERLIRLTLYHCINTYIKHITVGARSVLDLSLYDSIVCNPSATTRELEIWTVLWRLIFDCLSHNIEVGENLIVDSDIRLKGRNSEMKWS